MSFGVLLDQTDLFIITDGLCLNCTFLIRVYLNKQACKIMLVSVNGISVKCKYQNKNKCERKVTDMLSSLNCCGFNFDLSV